ncbi:MAG: hypothetical protein ABMA25_00655 [Ilumatobacteraceae bacterium]
MLNAPAGCSFDAVDIDPVSVTVAAAITGQNITCTGIEDWHPARSSRTDGTVGYDFAVGNVPFSSIGPGRNNPHHDNLHNYAIDHAVRMLRPGGVAALLTSRFTLDSRNSRFRERLAQSADLIAAVRLPSGSHRQCGTDAVTDLLILRKPHPGETRPNADWIHTSPIHGITGTQHNSYWESHPDHVLGSYQQGGAHGGTNVEVLNDHLDTVAEQLANLLHQYDPRYQPAGDTPDQASFQRAQQRASERDGIRYPAGTIHANPDGSFTRDGQPFQCPATQADQLTALIGLRDLTYRYLAAPDDTVRDEMAATYQAYTQRFGYINTFTTGWKRTKLRPDQEPDVDDIVEERDDGTRVVLTASRNHPPMGRFRTDPGWWVVASLETFDDLTMTGQPAGLLTRDTIREASRWPEQADTPATAVANSMSRYGTIDPAYVCTQLGIQPSELHDRLDGIAYLRPDTTYELAATYLAGDVVTKLEQATQAAATDSRYAANVTALRDAQPAPLTAAMITPTIGVNWITPSEYADFVHHLTSSRATINYHAPTNAWEINGYINSPAKWSTKRRTTKALLEEMLTMTATLVTTEIDGNRIVDVEATAEAQDRREDIQSEFRTWLFADTERTATIVDRYNRTFNRWATQKWSGEHLSFEGLAADFEPREHQRDVVWRILNTTDRGTLLAHGVGAGKTAAMIIAGHEARRTGRVNGTNVYAVPKSMVDQFALDYLRLYPAARILTPPAGPDGRREFLARLATGDFDAAICSHQTFTSIPITVETQRAALEQRLVDLTPPAGNDWSRTLHSQLERARKKVQERLDRLDDNADQTLIPLEHLGIGMLFVDEAHIGKNIQIVSKQTQLANRPSARADDLLTKCDWIRANNGPGNLVFATATPVTNSPAEMWVFSRFLDTDALDRQNLRHFDAFAANYLQGVAQLEFDAGGNLSLKTRYAEYTNLPDLARAFRAYADVRATNTTGVALPRVRDGRPSVHIAQPTTDQNAVSEWLSRRADNPTRGDAIVAVYSTGRASALHPKAISQDTIDKFTGPALHDATPTGKILDAAREIARIYHETGNRYYPPTRPGVDDPAGASQLVFCDLGVPGSHFNVYDLLQRELTARGVDHRHIEYIHDHPTDRETLFQRVRAGHTRVLIGSTQQMGVGVNVQHRLAGVHELTAPWRPDWLEQAEGRAIRQGNHNDTVEIHRYATAHTLDTVSWQTLERKARFINQAMSDPTDMARIIEDASTVTVAEEYAEIKAAACGDQRIVELASLTAQVNKLTRARRAHEANHHTQRRTIDVYRANIDNSTRQLANIAALPPKPETVTTEPETVTDTIRDLFQNKEHPATGKVTIDGIPFNYSKTFDWLELTAAGTDQRRIWDRHQLLDRKDGGRGIATAILNTTDRIHSGELASDLRHDVTWYQRQLDTELANPVAEHYPRQGELDQVTRRRDVLQLALAAPRTQQPETVTPEPETVSISTNQQLTAAVDAVFGTAHYNPQHHNSFIVAYQTHQPNSGAVIPNRHGGVDQDTWARWVETRLQALPAGVTASVDIGALNGVELRASTTRAGAVSIHPARQRLTPEATRHQPALGDPAWPLRLAQHLASQAAHVGIVRQHPSGQATTGPSLHPQHHRRSGAER